MKKRWWIFIGVGVLVCLLFGFSPWLIRYAESDEILTEVPEDYVMEEWYQSRETLALYKAVFDLYIWEPDYLL